MNTPLKLSLSPCAHAVLGGLRRLQTKFAVIGKKSFLSYSADLHVGPGTRLWAPHHLRIGRSVYIGKQVLIEANATIGDYCIIANRVAFVGRRDHDIRQLGVPTRFATWVGDEDISVDWKTEEVVLEPDVWIGYAAILLTGVTIGRGAVVGAGAVVTKHIPPYAIACGTPARIIGYRFNRSDIRRHETAIENGKFLSSERGRAYFTIAPDMTMSNNASDSPDPHTP